MKRLLICVICATGGLCVLSPVAHATTPTTTATVTATPTATTTATATATPTSAATPYFTAYTVPGGCEQIPNYTGIGAGQKFRMDINNHLCGVTPISPELVPVPFAVLNNTIETDGWMFYCKDCSETVPCSGGGAGAIAFGEQGIWSCASGVVNVTGGITAITAGAGLSGGGTSGNVTVSLSTPVSIADGGTNATNASAARSNLGAAASGTNSDITSMTGLTTPLGKQYGGTNCASNVSFSHLPGGGALIGTICTVTDAPACVQGTQVITGGGSAICTVAWNGANWMPMNGSVSTTGGGTITGVTPGTGISGGGMSGNVTVSLTTPVSIANGGTNSTSAAGALASLGGAARGANSDITSLMGLTTPLGHSYGGTGCGSPVGFIHLPAGGALIGTICTLTDAPACAQGQPVAAGGGSTFCTVVWNGSNWIAMNGTAAAPGANADITSLGAVTTYSVSRSTLTATGSVSVPDVNAIDVSVTGAATMNLPACASRHMLNLMFVQDSSGHAVTFSPAAGWSLRPATPPSVPVTANLITPYSFICDPADQWYVFAGYQPGE
ncbi:MAG TPA: hypothetical protein VMU16_15450 [Candidatus Binataceae bacterium]|nr:hypothetical protein [Candidatus Binataceae bacterium]